MKEVTGKLSDEKFVCFSISNEENAMTPKEIEDYQFQKVHFRIYSADRVNDHNYTCSLKVLKKYPPKSYFCVSTDKAANPTNIMGASKRIMEDLIFAFSANKILKL